MKKYALWKFLLCFVIFFMFQAAITAMADDRKVITDFSTGVNADGVPDGWQLKEKSGHADLSVVADNALHVLRLRSMDTSFSIQKEVNVDVHQYPIFTWKWKATKLPEGGDFRKSGNDDQAAQLFLAFSRTKAIVYVWDTTAPEGMVGDADAPFFMKIKVVVVRSGPEGLGKWITETRNVYRDYQKFFGSAEKSPKVGGIRIQINSQHTKTSAESYFADVVFQKQR